MKKSIVAAVALAAVLVGVIVALHRLPAQEPAAAEPAAVPGRSGEILTAPVDGQQKAAVQHPKVRFDPKTPVQTVEMAEEASQAPSPGNRGREWYYDRLLVKQGRDRAKEQQLTSTMMTVFGDRIDTLVGPTSCSSQFCRVELRAVGKMDIRDHWQPEVISAVDPKGFSFFIVNDDDDGNTIMNFYFGRDESWTVPDFRALGML
jgi:hypothetical protein